MLNFLQYIIQQPSDSILNRMLNAQTKNPTKGDWYSTVSKLIEKYDLKLSLSEIFKTKPSIFKNLVKKHIKIVAFRELVEKQKRGQKGRQINYERLEMSDYLLPECQISVEDKKELFLIRSEMNELPCNFGNPTLCELGCSQVLNSEHINSCPKLNKKEALQYENILNGTMNQKVLVLKKIQENNAIRINKLRDSVNCKITC